MKKMTALVLTVLLMVCQGAGMAKANAATTANKDWQISVRELSAEEFSELVSDGTQNEVWSCEEVSEPTDIGRVAYTEHEYTKTYGFYDGSVLLATATMRCIVWRYTDGKVHLYSRGITTTREATSIGIAREYGSIVNTNGSRSYTTGDRIYLSKNLYNKTFAIEFYVTPFDMGFSCYEV